MNKDINAIGIVKQMVTDGQISQEVAEKYFPELAESEDERIRKEIIDFATKANNGATSILANNYNFNKWIVWLGKRAEPKEINPSEFDSQLNRLLGQFKSLPKEELASSLSFYLNVVQNDGTYKEEKQGEHDSIEEPNFFDDFRKTDSEVEPKFKVGDWVVYECSGETATLQIARIVGETYVFSDDSTLDVVDEDTLRLWDITKDAKDGDVLCTKNKCCPFIYDKGRYNNGLAYYYAGIDVCGNLNIKSPHNMLAHFGKLDNICPATQEQRDLLFKKMKEAGYEWDAELKQLKKIEQKPVKVPKFKVGDFIQFNGMGQTVTIKEVCGLSHYINTCNKRMDMSYTDANFELVEQKPNGWSEEDERIKNNLLSELTNLSVRKLIEKDTEKKYANWLKSLRPQSQWKPSDKQMELLREVQQALLGKDCHNRFVDFMYELKRLREE